MERILPIVLKRFEQKEKLLHSLMTQHPQQVMMWHKAVFLILLANQKRGQGYYFVLPSHKAPYHKIWLRQTFCSSSWGRLCLR